MKFVIVYLVLFVVCSGSDATAQIAPLYFSRQTGQATSFNGSYTKQTDKYEQASISLSKEGPLTCKIDPASYSIQPNETKSWSGSITVDPLEAPAPGSSVKARLIADYQVQYSRPYGWGTGGTIVSAYSCSDSGSGSGCIYHNGMPGMHEIVSETDRYAIDFNVISIRVDIPDTICLGPTGQDNVTAVGFPADAGSFAWSTTNPNVKITDADKQTAHIQLLDTTVKNAVVKVKYTIRGIAYEAQSVVLAEGTNSKDDKKKEDKKEYLVRFGAEPESAEKLAADAAAAEKDPRFGHGVSTTLKTKISGSDKKHRSALLSDAAKHFKINPSPTKNNPNHVTVILPKPVTKEVAEQFNALFKTRN